MQDYNKDEIDLQQLLRILSENKLLIFSKKNKIFFITFLFALIGYVFATFFWDEEYKADLTFVVEEEAGSMGGLSSAIGIASQFGFDLGTGGGSTFTESNIIELLKSRQAIASVLLKEKKIGREKTLLIEHYLKINNLWDELVIDNPNVTNFQDEITQHHDSIINLVWLEIIDNNISNIHSARLSATEVDELLKGKNFRRMGEINIKSYDFSHILVDPPRCGLTDKVVKFLNGVYKIIDICA